MGRLHVRLVRQALSKRGHARRGRQLAHHRPRREPRVDRAGHHGRRRALPVPDAAPVGPRAGADRHSRDPDGRLAAHLLRAAEFHAGPRVGGGGAHRLLHRLRRHRGPLPARRDGRVAHRGGPRLRGDALAGISLRHAAAHHAGRDRGRADGVHAFDRRLRDHVLHGRRRNRDAAAADLLDDQDRGDAGGQRGVDALDAVDVGAHHHRL